MPLVRLMLPVPTLLVALLAAPATLAQTQSAQTSAGAATLPAELQKAYQLARPATLRLEDCPDTVCKEPDGIGSAVVISPDGLALTAYHVVFDSHHLTAVTVGHQRYSVSVVGYDDQADLALLKVKVPGNFPSLNVAAKLPQIGDRLLAIGNGGGAFLRPKYGKLLKLDVPADRPDFPSNTLQMSAQLIPGDSGGPILNARGEVEGVTSYIDASGERIISYAVPVSSDSNLLASLKAGTKHDVPVMGLRFQGDIDPENFPKVGLGPKPGAVPTSVQKGSPADKAGLRPLKEIGQPSGPDGLPTLQGDVITAVDGKATPDSDSLLKIIRSYSVGDTVTLSVQRGNKSVQIKVTLASNAQIFGAQADTSGTSGDSDTP